jgi:PKD repeat protein
LPVIDGCSDIDGPVSVTNIETGDSDSAGVFTYLVPEPTITSITPTMGPEAGDTVVTITGVNFSDPVRVLFGDAAGTVTSVTPSAITVRTPRFSGTLNTEPCDENGDGTQGVRNLPTTVDVEVINLITECDDDTFTNAFTYIPTDQSCRNDDAPPPPPNPPVAAFSFTVTGMQVNFVDASTGNPTSYFWDFGSAGAVPPTSVVANPVVTYPAAGAYTVTLLVSNADGSDSTAQVVTIP